MGVDATSLFIPTAPQKPAYQVVAQNMYAPPAFGERPIGRFDQFQANSRARLINDGHSLLDQFNGIYRKKTPILSDTRDMADHKYNTKAERLGKILLPEYADIYWDHNPQRKMQRMHKFVLDNKFANCEFQAALVNDLARQRHYNSKIIMLSFPNPKPGELPIVHFAVAIAPQGFNDWGKTGKVAQNVVVVDTWAAPERELLGSIDEWIAQSKRIFEKTSGRQYNPEVFVIDDKGDVIQDN